MERINKLTGEILNIPNGGLYSAFPIPAYKVLARAGEHIAKDVLLCLVSHLGKKNRESKPSYTLICKESGRSRESVARGIRTLEEFGFIRKYQYRTGNKLHNKYYVLDSCYQNKKMNSLALEFMDAIGRCKSCNAHVKYGSVGVGKNAYHHYGCGGEVWIWNSAARKVPRVAESLVGEEMVEQ
jgi:hypothetical protein